MSRLAILGGEPTFREGVPFFRPAAPPLDRVMSRVRDSYDRGVLTNGPLVRELEEATAARLQVAHVVAVASCTAGLMLVLRALAPPGRVLLPSFTFSASAHAVAWNGCMPVFAECDPCSFQLDVGDAANRMDHVDAVMATHVFGAPCDVSAVDDLAGRHGVPAVFDAAHAFGASHDDRPVGSFGDAEVFSLSPTKPLTAGEGGLVATNSAVLADAVRIGRNYGDPGNYDTQLVGLNARMSELHAALALESLADLAANLEARRGLADRYVHQLATITGVRAQAVADRDTSTWKDFTIVVDEADYGLERDGLAAALRAEGVDTRTYFDPPVHRQRAHRTDPAVRLPVTEQAASSVLSLPLYPALPTTAVDQIIELTVRIQESAEEVRATFAGGRPAATTEHDRDRTP